LFEFYLDPAKLCRSDRIRIHNNGIIIIFIVISIFNCVTFTGYTGYVNTQARDQVEEYGFAGVSNGYMNGSAAAATANGYNMNGSAAAATANAGPAKTSNGYADMSGKRTPDNLEDKWYMKDSMRPVGAASHGLHCKCYRCQRKLTAI
jgi:hypothetical protein